MIVKVLYISEHTGETVLAELDSLAFMSEYDGKANCVQITTRSGDGDGSQAWSFDLEEIPITSQKDLIRIIRESTNGVIDLLSIQVDRDPETGRWTGEEIPFHH